MAPRRGTCFRCGKFQTQLKRHLKTCQRKHEMEPPLKRRAVTLGQENSFRDPRLMKIVTTVTEQFGDRIRNIKATVSKTVRVEHFHGRDRLVPTGTAPGPRVLSMMQKGVSQATTEFNQQYVHERFPELGL